MVVGLVDVGEVGKRRKGRGRHERNLCMSALQTLRARPVHFVHSSNTIFLMATNHICDQLLLFLTSLHFALLVADFYYGQFLRNSKASHPVMRQTEKMVEGGRAKRDMQQMGERQCPKPAARYKPF